MARRIKSLPISWFWSLEQQQGSQRQGDELIHPSDTSQHWPTEGSGLRPQAGPGETRQVGNVSLGGQDLQAIGSGLASAPPPAAQGCRGSEAETAAEQEVRPVSAAAAEWVGSGLLPEPVPSVQSAERRGSRTPSKDTQEMLCHELVAESALSPDPTPVTLSATPILDLGYTFQLSSRPGASKTIYLDFNGHTTTGTAWNDATMGSSFYSPAYDIDGNPSSFSDAELTRIQQAWQRVANDFSSFDVNVTTLEPPADWLSKSSDADPNYGIRAVVTSYGPYSSSAGGVGLINSFTFSNDAPVYIYMRTIPEISEAISHEVGHSLGLAHDGNAITSSEYYAGHGTGETSWAPIMGVSYQRSVTTWDDGTYTGSNNIGSTANYGKGADDMAVIVGNNGFSFQPDLVGNGASMASLLSVIGGTVNQFGTIETRTDTDWYSFQLLDTGSLNLSFDPYWYRVYVDGDGVWGGDSTTYLSRASEINTSTPYPDNASNLDLAVDLYDSQGALLSHVDSPGLATSMALQGLAAGSYYLKLDGVGFGDPTASTPTGYTDYASIGNYMITGSITAATDSLIDPVITLDLSPATATEDGSGNLVYTFTRSVVTVNPLTVSFTVSGTAANGSDYSGLVAGSNQTVTFAANAATASVVIDPAADSTVEADETVGLMLAPGAGYSIGTSSAIVGTISNDDLAPVPLVFTAKTDTLTGLMGADSFGLNRLSDSLWSATPDRITNLQAGVDSLDSPVSRTSAIKPKLLGSVKTLDVFGIGTLLTNKNLVKNGAAIFTFNDSAGLRTFLAINDATAGFNASTDSVIEITGYSGSLSSLSVF